MSRHQPMIEESLLYITVFGSETKLGRQDLEEKEDQVHAPICIIQYPG